MRFELLEAKNYRQYKDVKYDFPQTTPNDIHLIIATNGVGKTNFLNAVNWCLYGDEPHTSGTASNNDKLPLCNLDALKESEKKGEEFCEVSVYIEATDDGIKYSFKRTARFKVTAKIQIGKDEFEVNKMSKEGIRYFEGQEAIDLVNKFLPKRIREYFYFDGERLLNYFNENAASPTHIKDSIYQIAQVNLINDVGQHLLDFEKRYNKSLSKLSPDLDNKLSVLEDITSKIDETKKLVLQLTAQIEEAEANIADIDGYLNGTESVVGDNKKFDKNNEEIKHLEKKLEEANTKLVHFLRKYFIQILLYKRNRITEEYIEDSAKRGDATLDTSVEIIKDSLEKHKCKICGSQLNESAEIYLQSLVDKFIANKTLQKLSEIKNDIHRSLDLTSYDEEKEAIFNELDEIETSINSLNEQNAELQKRIGTVSQIQTVQDKFERKQDLMKSRDRNLEKRGSYNNQLENLKIQEQKARKEYENAVSANKDCEEIKKYLDFVKNARFVIEEVKQEIVDDVKNKMEATTMDYFEQLFWKKQTYGRIELDDNFRLKLFHKETNISCLNSCSAAEKELLALAFTIALHKVSGYDNLLIIDTPVGRVSDINRENFAKQLLQISESKQLILAFTPSEYSDEIKTTLTKNVVSTLKILESDEKNTVLKG